MSVQSISDKKIKIWSKAIANRVIVIQDGSASDADIDGAEDLQIDDGFANGWNYGETNSAQLSRMTFDILSLRANSQGKEFTFQVQDYTNWNSLGLTPGDRIEFSMNVGASLPVGGSWPSWHAGALSADTQQVVFYGFIDEIRRRQDDSGLGVYEVVCVDTVKYANKIKIVQSVSEGVTIPWVIFNCDDPADPDRMLSIKLYDGADPVVTQKFRQGNSLTPGSEKMSVGDILNYLQNAYQAELYARGIVTGVSDLIFDSSEIAAFTEEPPKTVFEDRGFGDAVRDLIRSNLPDHELTVDPRSNKWRIRPVLRDMMKEGTATITSEVSERLRWGVDDASGFNLTGDGSTFRIQSVDNLYASEVRDVSALVTGGSDEIEADAQVGFSYQIGDKIIPMYDVADRPPVVTLDLDEDASRADLVIDLNGVYSAVEIVGRRQIRERKKITDTVSTKTGLGIPNVKLVPAYDPDHEDNTNFYQHRNRRIDRGPAPDYPGISIHEITTAGSSPNEFTRLFFSEEHSAFENDHSVPNLDGNQGEWKGAAVHFLTEDGEDIENASVTAICTYFARAGYIDDPTDTIRRFRVDLDRNILDDLPDLKDEVNDADPDLLQLSMAEMHKPQNPNQRWAVGRVWRMESTTTTDESRLLDTSNCLGNIEYPSLLNPNITIQQSAIATNQVGEAPRTFQEVVDYHGLNPTSANPLTGGVPRAWFINPPEPPPTMEEVCASIPEPPPPRTITLEVDKLTQEVRSVRVPATGYGGAAYWWYNHQETLTVLTDNFEHESQEGQFQAIADAMWHRVQQPHYTGQIPLNGVEKWVRMIDLGFRVRLGSGSTGPVSGVVTEQSRFWALCQSVDIDFKGMTTSIAFESTGFADTIKQDLFERQFVSETAEMKSLKEKAKILEQKQNCLAERPPAPPPHVVPGCDVAVQGQSVSRKVSVIDPKNVYGGGSETSIGIPGQDSINPNSVSGSLSFNPNYIVERNLRDGTTFAIHNPSGATVGGSMSDEKKFVPSTSTPPIHNSVVKANAEAEQEIDEAFLGIDLNTPAQGQPIVTDSGSTSTVINLRFAVPDDGRFDGGYIEFRPDRTNQSRPRYLIDTHTADEVTLDSAMSESPPLSGVAGTIYPAPLPTLDETDFPTGGVPFQDSEGDWHVAKDGDTTPASLTDGVLSDTDGEEKPEVTVGFSGGTHKPRGDWDFSNASSLALATGVPLDELAAMLVDLSGLLTEGQQTTHADVITALGDL